MTAKYSMVFFAVLLSVSLGASTGHAKRISLNLSSADLTAQTPDDPGLGTYYVLNFRVPPGAARVQWAFLEFYVDVASRAREGMENQTPLFEVYPLKSAFSGEVDPAEFQAQDLPTTRHVVAGSGRRVVIDITEIVNSYAANPASNHGLIVGSLTGTRDGLFTIRSGDFGPSSLGRITFFCAD